VSEQDTMRQGILFGKRAMQAQVIQLFESMKSQDPTDTPYSIANVITIQEAIQAINSLEK
jgi:hypothetical protein